MKIGVELLTLVIGLAAACVAVFTYRQNVKLERGKWLKELYEKFYERDGLKKVRDLLDGNDEQAKDKLIKEESPDFTDYLNFFEFVAYLWKTRQISLKETEGIFDYYLRSLRENNGVAEYIENPANGFEQLRELLKVI